MTAHCIMEISLSDTCEKVHTDVYRLYTHSAHGHASGKLSVSIYFLARLRVDQSQLTSPVTEV